MRVIHRVHNAAHRIRSRIEESNDGFTLIELIVVIAILGILIAIAVPTIRGFLENSKEQAYDADQRVIQLAVDAYYFSPRNERYNNDRQFPVEGKLHQNAPISDGSDWRDTNARLYLESCVSDSANSPIKFRGNEERADDLRPPENPILGTKGGTPIWQDGTGVFNDDVRNDPSRDKGLIYCPPEEDSDDNVLGDDRFDHWEAVVVTTQGEECNPTTTGGCIVISSRDFIIDFCELVRGGFIEDIPESASADHNLACAGPSIEGSDDSSSPELEGGSYTWYVDDAGKVQSLYYFLPTEDRRGYWGVYP